MAVSLLSRDEYRNVSLTCSDELPPVPLVPATKKFRAVYKFHEGSSSAVRKTIKMSALM